MESRTWTDFNGFPTSLILGRVPRLCSLIFFRFPKENKICTRPRAYLIKQPFKSVQVRETILHHSPYKKTN